MEGQYLDQKSLRYALGRHQNAEGLACDCVAFANAAGGTILLGIEDGESDPPVSQRVEDDLPDRLRKRIGQITANVGIDICKVVAANGGEYLEIRVRRNDRSIAGTSDGRYFLRVSDQTRRLLPDDLGRLFSDKSSFCWELQTPGHIAPEACDSVKLEDFLKRIRASQRISSFIRGKSARELLEYYCFVKDGVLTNLGILWIGRPHDRAALVHAPEIQCIKFDELGHKVRKQVWNDHDLSPPELIDAVWQEVPDWVESYELPDGMYRKTVPHYDEVVVRELLANALVHRPYTQRGDIFINLHPDKFEIHNPGLLPIGVTPQNILHASSKRNPNLARVFYDLNLMEGEGSGFDRMYEILLMSGRPIPEVQEGHDRVAVTIRKKFVRPEILDFMAKAAQTFTMTQKETIALGLLAQHETLSAIELTKKLDLPRAQELADWIGRLRSWNVVKARGRTKGTEYFIAPTVLRDLKFQGRVTLKGIEWHRLRELILRDLEIYGRASIGEIHQRIGKEIPYRKLRFELSRLVAARTIGMEGSTRAAVYHLDKTTPNQG